MTLTLHNSYNKHICYCYIGKQFTPGVELYMCHVVAFFHVILNCCIVNSLITNNSCLYTAIMYVYITLIVTMHTYK